jgi:hypothetical protein
MTSEDQTLLYKAAADPNGQIALKRSRCGEWHADRDRLDVLARCGHGNPIPTTSPTMTAPVGIVRDRQA